MASLCGGYGAMGLVVVAGCVRSMHNLPGCVSHSYVASGLSTTYNNTNTSKVLQSIPINTHTYTTHPRHPPTTSYTPPMLPVLHEVDPGI